MSVAQSLVNWTVSLKLDHSIKKLSLFYYQQEWGGVFSGRHHIFGCAERCLCVGGKGGTYLHIFSITVYNYVEQILKLFTTCNHFAAAILFFLSRVLH